MILRVSGSRTITDRALVWGALDAFFGEAPISEPRPVTEVIHGGCRGVDTLAQDWAFANRIPERIFPADWSRGPAAGALRNQRMIDEADALVAVWDGESRGTADAIKRARVKGIRVVVVAAKT